jgi:hypothetical protein
MEDLGKDVGGEVHLWGILGEREHLSSVYEYAAPCRAVCRAFHPPLT